MDRNFSTSNPHCAVSSKHAVSKPKGHFLKLEQVVIKIEMLNYKDMQKEEGAAVVVLGHR